MHYTTSQYLEFLPSTAAAAPAKPMFLLIYSTSFFFFLALEEDNEVLPLAESAIITLPMTFSDKASGC